MKDIFGMMPNHTFHDEAHHINNPSFEGIIDSMRREDPVFDRTMDWLDELKKSNPEIVSFDPEALRLDRNSAPTLTIDSLAELEEDFAIRREHYIIESRKDLSNLLNVDLLNLDLKEAISTAVKSDRHKPTLYLSEEQGEMFEEMKMVEGIVDDNFLVDDLVEQLGNMQYEDLAQVDSTITNRIEESEKIQAIESILSHAQHTKEVQRKAKAKIKRNKSKNNRKKAKRK